MVKTDGFDLEIYLATYSPKSLSSADWQPVRDEVLDLVRRVEPMYECDAKNLLGGLCRYLARTQGGAGLTVSSLTSDGIDSFIAGERLAGAKDSTLGRVSRHLRRLLEARSGGPRTTSRRTKGATRPVFDPISDGQWECLDRKATDLDMAHGNGLSDFLKAGEACGFTPEALTAAGWGPSRIRELRQQLQEHALPDLELHRLRHRWLRSVLSEIAPISELVARHNLTRRDLERAVQGFTVQQASYAMLRCA